MNTEYWLSADVAELEAALNSGSPVRIFDLPPAARAWLAWTLHRRTQRAILVVLDGTRTLDEFFEDLSTLCGSKASAQLACFPAEESAPTRARRRADEQSADRLDTLRRLNSDSHPGVIATCVPALLQPTWAPAALQQLRRRVATNDACPPAPLAAWMEAAGYRFAVQVQEKGAGSLRGGILDVWPPHAEWPSRIEFDGDRVESIRSFDPWSQVSRGTESFVEITPPAFAPDPNETAVLMDHLPPGAAVLWVDPLELERRAELWSTASREAERGRNTADWSAVRAAAAERAAIQIELDPLARETDVIQLSVRPLASLPSPAGEGGVEPERIASERANFVSRLIQRASPEHPLWFTFSTGGAWDRFRELYLSDGIPPGVSLREGGLTEGFEIGPTNRPQFTVVSESDLYGRRNLPLRYDLHGRRAGPLRQAAGERILDAGELEPGEWVVHAEHGIGKYLGLTLLREQGAEREALAVEYADKARLYIPVSQAHLLSRYIGAGRARPEPHRLGGVRWAREKEAAARAVQDLAAQLLETQAAREARPGHAFPPDTPWQHELESAFPYVETPDQREAIGEVKRDMESPRPMDRLVCGDVGFGKTEVALRAVFKAVMGGRQAAVLVPTTVLAQQHYETFRTRMAAFPVRIELLSRYRSRAEQRDTVERLGAGATDVVIGTHRLVQPDVRFRDLGLVVIDEEQRFGVAHKEALKRLRSTVDVLTMTATPIPRTLYLSLSGARDLSVIQTPPQDRLPVETVVCAYDEHVVREAILRELNREGQVFYLHNRVETIAHALERLRKLAPEARIEMAHGQMTEGMLERIMRRFVAGEFDVLLCTTIIESGIDIPRVNTILIERADRFGLADLYQLRGRVGRYRHQAFAYLLLPRHGRLFDNARRRMGALRKYSGLGAGFKVALRDLETRGAGNVLGAEQSGHIAAVGFDLYCQLLHRTVAALKGEPLPRPAEAELKLTFMEEPGPGRGAGIPGDYIEDESLRLRMYRRISAALEMREIDQLSTELRDRFGVLPPETRTLLDVARIRLAARDAHVDAVESDGHVVHLKRGNDWIMPEGRHPRLRAHTLAGRLKEIRRLLEELALVPPTPGKDPTRPSRQSPARKPRTSGKQDRWKWPSE
ncbi:MAG: transcription-repair coupling factor [Kiritimatiellae bacterium]|nr:transcription-repair coupling factor [Kiritimatiellia bacterium]